VLAVVLAPASATQAQGTIAYFRPGTPFSFGPAPGFESCSVDLNDGLDDFTFESSMSSTVLPLRGHRILMLPEPPPDIGGFVQPLTGAHFSFLSTDVRNPNKQPFSLDVAAVLTDENRGNVAGCSKTECTRLPPAPHFGIVGPGRTGLAEGHV
jgi:hypothetical protein